MEGYPQLRMEIEGKPELHETLILVCQSVSQSIKQFPFETKGFLPFAREALILTSE